MPNIQIACSFLSNFCLKVVIILSNYSITKLSSLPCRNIKIKVIILRGVNDTVEFDRINVLIYFANINMYGDRNIQ